MSNKRMRGLLWKTVGTLAVLALAGGAFLYGFLVARTERPPFRRVMRAYYKVKAADTLMKPFYWLRKEGRFSGGVVQPLDEDGEDSLSRMQREEIRELEALGYLRGVETAAGEGGVLLYDSERAQPGLNLYTTGLAPEASLIDMEGRVVHRWRLPFERAFPSVEAPPGATGVHYWRRVFLYPNGDLLAIYENLGIIKLDRESKLVWALPNQSHHDLEVLENGEIYALTLKRHMVPSVNDWRPVVEDFITVIDPNGVELRRSSLIEALQRSSYASLLESSQKYGDLLHTNTLEILDGRHDSLSPHFRRGRALVSFNSIDTIAIVDLADNRVVWARTGRWHRQHDPRLLPNGNFLVFDNLGHRGWSKVIEFDALTDEIVWGYYGDEKNGFRTRTCGSGQRLANGNTLITETDAGRAFEVTAAGEIVWEFMNPDRVGEENELIASVYEMTRLEPETLGDWWKR